MMTSSEGLMAETFPIDKALNVCVRYGKVRKRVYGNQNGGSRIERMGSNSSSVAIRSDIRLSEISAEKVCVRYTICPHPKFPFLLLPDNTFSDCYVQRALLSSD